MNQSFTQTNRSCNQQHCNQCLVCTHTIFEERRADRWKQKGLPTLHRLYQAMYLLQIRRSLTHAKNV